MIEYIELVEKFISLLSSDDIKKLFSIKKFETYEIWGNYNAFFKSLENPRSEMCRIRNIYINNHILEQLNINMYLVGKISYKKLFKRYWILSKTLWNYRNDLNIISRLQLLFIKLRKVSRIEFQLNLNEYWNNQEQNNKLIKKIFDDHIINELYLYKIQNK